MKILSPLFTVFLVGWLMLLLALHAAAWEVFLTAASIATMVVVTFFWWTQP